MEDSKFRPRDGAQKGDSPGGVRTPNEGESSSSNVPIRPLSPLPEDATLVDYVPSATPRPAPSGARRSFSGLFISAAILQAGDVLGNRYDILQLLGEGGMGAVYKAKDRELDRFIALKLIRPELAASPDILARFKQELLLAHQVTHKNVIRIYDLADADGVKFITMEFVEGSDLRKLLVDKGKVPAAEAVEIIRQICYALHAAHSVGVIHRDLKPQNVMRDKQGRILVMDFGLARSVESDGMTQTGALVGTMEYMSPEQAMGSALDQRSDLFALGLIFFELLTGSVPYKAETALASLLKRNQQRAIPAITVDPNIPKSLSDIVSKCLERDLNLRYQNIQEILNDLDAWEGKRKVAASSSPNVLQRWATTLPVRWIGVGALGIVVLVGGGVLLRNKFATNPGAVVSGPVTSLAILPFRNASGDSSLDWLGSSVAETLATDVGQSSQLRTVSPNRINQIFTDLRIAPSTVLDSATVKRVAEFSSADRLVFGQYVKLGDQIRIDATLQDIKNDRSISLKADVANEKDIPTAVDRLAESIRTQLSLPSSVVKELKATSFQPTTQSVTALRDYNQGIGFQREGRNLDAQKQFEAATKEDSNFALAFARLGQIYGNLGLDNEAEQSVQKAVGLSQNLSDAQKYLIAAIRSQVLRDYPEAIKAYESLAKASSDNSDVQFVLSNLYADSGKLDKAREYCQKVLTANPKDIPATIQLGRITIRSGDPQSSLEPLNRAFSMAIQTDNQEQRATSLHLTAVAYRMLGKPEEGLRSETDALAIWRQIGQKRGLAYSLNEMGMAQSLLGKTKDAQANYEEALQVRRDIGDKRGLGDTLIDLGNFYGDQGDNDRALKMYKEALQLERDLGNESLQAICLNNIGTTYSLKGQFEDALAYFQQALQLREKSNVPQDIVEAVHNLADTSAEMGQYEQAISQYLRALDLRRSMDDKRGAAIESYSLGKLFGYQGRFGAAVKSKDESLKTLRDLKDKTYWMAEMLGGYGQALVLAGRAEDAKGSLTEALSLSTELKNDGMVAQSLGFQGDASFYRGDFKAAEALYARALQTALRSKEPDKIVIAKSNLAKVQVAEKRAAQAIAALRPLIQAADEIGVKYVSVECSTFMAEAMIQIRNNTQARQELDRALLRADKSGMQPLSARIHFLLAGMESAAGNTSEAQNHSREVLRLLDEMKKDPGAENMLERADFKNMYEVSGQRLK